MSPQRRFFHRPRPMRALAAVNGTHQAVLEQGGTEHVADCVFDVPWPRCERPTQLPREACLACNRQLRTVPGWRPARLCVPQNRRNYALSLTISPPSFATDLQAYLDHLAGNDLFAETARLPPVPADYPLTAACAPCSSPQPWSGPLGTPPPSAVLRTSSRWMRRRWR